MGLKHVLRTGSVVLPSTARGIAAGHPIDEAVERLLLASATPRKFDLRKFDLRKFDLRTFDLWKFDLRSSKRRVWERVRLALADSPRRVGLALRGARKALRAMLSTAVDWRVVDWI